MRRPKHGRVELVKGAVPRLLKSREVLGDLERRAGAIAARAGGEPDYVVESKIGPARARASVHTETAAAMYDEATQRTLTRAIDAGR